MRDLSWRVGTERDLMRFIVIQWDLDGIYSDLMCFLMGMYLYIHVYTLLVMSK